MIVDELGVERKIQVQSFREISPLEQLPTRFTIYAVGTGGLDDTDLPRDAVIAMFKEWGKTQKIPAIKLMRSLVRGMGLKEAKDLVEGIVDGTVVDKTTNSW